MQILSVQIQDSYMEQFMDFVKENHSNITVSRDKNLELDPYFYERQQELHQIRADIKSGKMEMLSEEQYEKEIEQFFSKFEKQA